MSSIHLYIAWGKMADKAVASDSVGSVLGRTAPAAGLST